VNKEYYNTKESVDEYIKLAKDVNGIHLIEKLKMILPEESDVLEIGSGPGKDWRILNDIYNITGSDNSTEFLKRLIVDNPHGEFLELDAVTLNTEKKFDGIFSNKVLHHLKDHELIQSVKRQNQILNTKGIICHSFWKGEGNEVFKGLFVNYHNESDLKEVFLKYFKIHSVISYREFEDDDSILITAQKK